jgi:hypothetical protein
VSTARKKHVNPFYVLLLLVGVAFTVTACAYVTMIAKMSRFDQAQTAEDGGLIRWLEDHGATLMMVELAVLGVVERLTDSAADRGTS